MSRARDVARRLWKAIATITWTVAWTVSVVVANLFVVSVMGAMLTAERGTPVIVGFALIDQDRIYCFVTLLAAIFTVAAVRSVVAWLFKKPGRHVAPTP